MPMPKSVGHYSESIALMWYRKSHNTLMSITRKGASRAGRLHARQPRCADIGADVVILESEIGDMAKGFPARDLAFDLEEVDADESKWKEACFIQFVGTTESHAKEAILTNPDTNLLGEVGTMMSQPVPSEQLAVPNVQKNLTSSSAESF